MDTIELNPVVFSCRAPDAQSVFVAGSFNAWSAESLPLERQSDGSWYDLLPLPSGHHEFKFVVDGEWCCEPGCARVDHGCPQCCTNSFGTMNRVMEVR